MTKQQTPAIPPPAKAAAAVLGALAVVAAVLGVMEFVSTKPERAVVGIGGGLILVGYAAVLGLVTRGILQGRAWSRGPAIATQILHLPVAYSFLGGKTTWVGVLLALGALVVIVGLVVPSSTRVYARTFDSD